MTNVTNEKVSLNATIREYYTGDVYGQGELEKLTIEKNMRGEYILTARIPEEMAMELAMYCADLCYDAKKKRAELNYEAVKNKEFTPFPFEKVDFDFTIPVEDYEKDEDRCIYYDLFED
uniref:Uncharacterized protein n=1 Tax=Siphoviridae sp. ctTnV63 TaxID=2825523 RepID=A0A8S5NWN6_9CAUD|nr:MAG TPA: hypothetical protein [Siphoviridae sp. ctTnV63]